jgi:hypothetical protein
MGATVVAQEVNVVYGTLTGTAFVLPAGALVTGVTVVTTTVFSAATTAKLSIGGTDFTTTGTITSVGSTTLGANATTFGWGIFQNTGNYCFNGGTFISSRNTDPSRTTLIDGITYPSPGSFSTTNSGSELYQAYITYEASCPTPTPTATMTPTPSQAPIYPTPGTGVTMTIVAKNYDTSNLIAAYRQPYLYFGWGGAYPPSQFYLYPYVSPTYASSWVTSNTKAFINPIPFTGSTQGLSSSIQWTFTKTTRVNVTQKVYINGTLIRTYSNYNNGFEATFWNQGLYIYNIPTYTNTDIIQVILEVEFRTSW